LESQLRAHGTLGSEHLAQAARIDTLSLATRSGEHRLRALSKEVLSQLIVAQVQVTVFCDAPDTADGVFESLRALLRNQVVRHRTHKGDEFDDIDLDARTLDQNDWRRFLREPESCRVLVCDRTAEEGLNLHGGRKVVIHFEFSLSPNRVEQRMGRFDRFGIGHPVESVAMICADDPDEIAWVDCLDRGFEVFNQSVASLQYLVDEVVQSLPQSWMEQGTVSLVELEKTLAGPAGRIARERRRIDQQDTLDSLGNKPDGSFEELEAVDSDWRSWGGAVRDLAEKTLQLVRHPIHWNGPIPPGDEVFRLRYAFDSDVATLFPLSVFLTDFIGTLDTRAPGASSRSLRSYPYSLHRRTALSRDGQARRVRPLRFGDPLVQALLSFCQTDDRGRAFGVWRYWPGYQARDASGTDLFFRFSFLVEANLGNGLETAGGADERLEMALRRSVDGCLTPQFITVWVGVDGLAFDKPSEFLSAKYRAKPSPPADTGRDYNLNPVRWQLLSTREDAPWIQDWQKVCTQAHAVALAHLRGMDVVRSGIANARRLLNEQLQTRVAYLHNRIRRLSGFARQAEEAELVVETDRHERALAAVLNPTIHLDVVGAVFVSPAPLGAV
jgi:ATP-dependent helicase HepA